jgi:hypothetical protein
MRDHRLGTLLVGHLVDRQDSHILKDHFGNFGGGQHHVDAIAGQHQAADAGDVVDAERHGAIAVRNQAGDGGAFPGPVSLEAKSGSPCSSG